MDSGQIGIANWMGMDDRKFTSCDESREMDDNQSPFVIEATKLQPRAGLPMYGVPVP
jgi:hypothetical protein